jgi:WD40 repeat protein
VRDWPRSERDALQLDDGATSACFVPGTSWIAIGRRDSSVRVYDLATSQLVREFTWQTSLKSGCVDLACRADGALLAIACNDGKLRFFDPSKDGSARRDLMVFEMQSVAFDRTGSRLLAIGPNGTSAIRLQNLVEDKPVRHQITHAGNLTGGSFDATGRYVLTSSEDGTVIVRDAASGEPIAQLAGHVAPVLCAQFRADADGVRVITGAADGSARIWPVDPVAAARARKPRDLREDEIGREKRLAEPLVYH